MIDTKNTKWLEKLKKTSEKIDNAVIAENEMFAIKSYSDTLNKGIIKGIFPIFTENQLSEMFPNAINIEDCINNG